MAERLRQMALAGTARPDDQDGRLLQQIAPGCQVMNQGPVQIGQAREIEAFERFPGAKRGAAQAQAQGEFRLIAARHLIVDQEGKKLRVREL